MATVTTSWFSTISHIVPHSKTSNDRTINEYRIGKGVKGSGHRITYKISKHMLGGIKDIYTHTHTKNPAQDSQDCSQRSNKASHSYK